MTPPASPRDIFPWVLSILMVVVAAVMRSMSYLHDDVSWLITMAEQVYSGKKAYVDIIDINPPASFLIYLPQVALACILGITTEVAVTLSIFVGALASTAIAGFILLDAGAIKKSLLPYFSALALAILLVLCGDVFAQREQFALIAILPLMACYIARAVGHPPDRGMLLLAGIGGSIVLALKPHFVLAVTLPLFYVVWENRKTLPTALRTLFALENLTMALSQIVYLGAIYVLYPIYFRSIVPMAIDIYVPIRLSVGALLRHSSTWAICGSGALALAAWCRREMSPIFTISVLAAIGFAVAYIVQAKGWPYHAYPAVALFLFAAGFAFIESIAPRLLQNAPQRGVAIALICALLGLLVAVDLRWAKLPLSYPPIYSALKKIAPAHATVIGISEDDLRDPQITRLIGGTWVGRVPYQFMSRYAAQVIHTKNGLTVETAKRLLGYREFDRAILIDQIRKRKPDIILITAANLREWVSNQSKIAATLTAYRETSVVDGISIWTRR